MACKGSGVQIPSAPHNFMKNFVLETKELLLSQGVIAILAIIQIRIVATNLGPEVYGKIGVYWGLVALCFRLLNSRNSDMVLINFKNKDKNFLTNTSFYSSPQLPHKHNHVEISFRNLREQGLLIDGQIGAQNGLVFGLSPGATGHPFSYAFRSASPVMSIYYNGNENDARRGWNIPGIEYGSNGNVKRVANELARNHTPGKFRRWEPADWADLDTDVNTSPTNLLLSASSTSRKPK